LNNIQLDSTTLEITMRRRLELHTASFHDHLDGFRDAIAILVYLRLLGISRVYASPLITSRQGSVTDTVSAIRYPF
jgi:maltooligosyltrehalose synthase